MKTQNRNALIAILSASIFLLLFCALPAMSQTREEKLALANQTFNEAVSLFQKRTAENYLESLEKFQQAIKIYEEIGEKSEKVGLSWLVPGLIAERIGRKADALRFYDRALTFFREIKNKYWEATTLANLGGFYLFLGESRKALEYLNEALVLMKEVGDKGGEASTLVGIGRSYVDLGEGRKALDYFIRALPFMKEVGDKSGDKSGEAGTLTSIGAIYVYLGENLKALEYLNQALALWKKMRDKRGEARSLSDIGKVYYSLGEYTKALDYLNRALRLWKEGGEKDGEAITLNNIMYVWNTLNNRTLAIHYGKQSINIFQQLRSNIKGLDKSIQQTYLKSITYIYRNLADIFIAEGRFPEAQAVLDLLKEEEFSGLLRRSGNAEDSLPYSKAEAAAIAVLERIAALGRVKGELEAKNEKSALTDSEKTRLKEIIKEIETAEAEFNKALAALSNEKNKGQNFDVVVADAQAFMEDLKSLGKGTVALYTVVVNDEKPAGENAKEAIKTGWIILVTPEFRKAYPIDVKDLEKTVFTFREALRSDVYNPQSVAQNLYHKLFQQKGKDGKTLEADLDEYYKDKPERTLMWSLDGVLRYVPMAALHDGQTYLVEKYRNTVFNTASKARLKDEVKLKWTALGLGVSEERQESGKSFDKISGAKRELNAIVRENEKDVGILNGKILIDPQFTAEAMQDALLFDKNPVVHIASHFSFNPSDVDSSFLLLGKGKMTVKELTAKSTFFSNVDLLVLSACDTAMGSGNGKEVEGFAYVAQSLGAKAVIASLWSVADTGTDELMIRFYNLRAKNPNTPKGEIFRRAQLELLGAENKEMKPTGNRSGVYRLDGAEIKLPLYVKDEKKPFAHPHYWASFILIGNWR